MCVVKGVCGEVCVVKGVCGVVLSSYMTSYPVWLRSIWTLLSS